MGFQIAGDLGFVQKARNMLGLIKAIVGSKDEIRNLFDLNTPGDLAAKERFHPF